MVHSTIFEPGNLKLRLKQGLRFHPRGNSQSVWYLVEDRLAGNFFQISVANYHLISLIDGNRTVSELGELSSRTRTEFAIDEEDVIQLCQWLIDSNLVESEMNNTVEAQIQKSKKLQFQQALSLLNPISIRISLGSPDRMVGFIYDWTKWAYSGPGLLLWILILATACFILGFKGTELLLDRFRAVGPHDMIWIAVSWLGLKCVHELGHCLMCKKFGGRISGCGITFLMMFPLPFVDVSSAWAFHSKWKRILTSAAGMIAEWLIAAIAVIFWYQSEPGPIRYHLGNLILISSIQTLIFNANPLMRFDGYYILSDLLEIPNLYQHGRLVIQGWVKRIFLGFPLPESHETGWRKQTTTIYGLLSFIWQWVILLSLILATIQILPRTGIFLATIATLFWFGIPAFRFLATLFDRNLTPTKTLVRFFGIVGLTFAVVSACLTWLPGPGQISAPVVIDYSPIRTIRAQTTGILLDIYVADGQNIAQGQPIAKLENRELASELEQSAIDIEISQLRLKSYLASGEISKLKLERENLAALQNKRAELRRLNSLLEIRSDYSGQVIAPEIESKKGVHIELGSVICWVGNPETLKATAVMRPEDARWIQTEGTEVKIRIDGRGSSFVGLTESIEPKALEFPPHDALAAVNGGPLSVVEQSEGYHAGDTQTRFRLTSPRVAVKIQVYPADESPNSSPANVGLMPGETGMMSLRSRKGSLASYLKNSLFDSLFFAPEFDAVF
ncbi:MAG: biotin/lipoyl-binding protein [Planctomycetota bacterium]